MTHTIIISVAPSSLFPCSYVANPIQYVIASTVPNRARYIQSLVVIPCVLYCWYRGLLSTSPWFSPASVSAVSVRISSMIIIPGRIIVAARHTLV